MSKLFNRIARRFCGCERVGLENRTFSQCGEDRIVSHLFSRLLGIDAPTFLDIGANDPVILNNSYYFSSAGCKGVLIEPDPTLYKKIVAKRPRDKCLNVGIGDSEQDAADFFIFEPPEFNTFSAESASDYQAHGMKLLRTISIPLRSINQIISENFDSAPNFISLDAEGFDERIIRSMDFTKHRPEVFCIETVDYSTQEKIVGIQNLMIERGYSVYADTYINTIFVEKGRWNQAKQDWLRKKK
jgi:FkbM family methyltransferase